MTFSVGRIEEFDASTDNWRSYVERLEHYFKANKIDDSLQKDAFLACIGRKTFTLLRSLTAPDKPGDKEYDELVTLLTRHMAPKPLVIAERFRFHKRDQREGESINEYAAELQRLSEHCDFGTGLNDALRDRLVCGIRDEGEGVQKRLLTKENLTFDKALKMAEAAEQAGKDAAQFHNTSRLEKPLEDVHVVQSGGLSCSGCGGRHLRSKCRFKDVQCRFCKKKGHIERVCRSKPYQGVDNQNDPPQTRQSTKTLEKKKLHAMEETLSEEYYQLNWGRLRNIRIHSLGTVKPFYKTVVVEGQKMKMELDTGAAVSLAHILQQLFGEAEPPPFKEGSDTVEDIH